jgi:hypothetical protein
MPEAMGTTLRTSLGCGLVVAALIAPQAARSAGGRYDIRGTAAGQTQVRAALAVSSFDWSVLSDKVTVHIHRGIPTRAKPGEIWIDADLLDAGRFSWGVVLHEFGHQLDFFLLDEQDRRTLARALGTSTWGCAGSGRVPHGQQGCERFASMVAWAFWPAADNVFRPSSPLDESAAMSPRSFRALLAQILGG